LKALSDVASLHGLEIVTVTQVKRDHENGLRVAAALGGAHIDWPASSGHAEQETRLRELYRRAALVVSDRLHVLIAAATEGASVLSASAGATSKAARNFDTIGLTDVHVDLSGASPEYLRSRVEKALTGSARARLAVEDARRTIDAIVRDIRE